MQIDAVQARILLGMLMQGSPSTVGDPLHEGLRPQQPGGVRGDPSDHFLSGASRAAGPRREGRAMAVLARTGAEIYGLGTHYVVTTYYAE